MRLSEAEWMLGNAGRSVEHVAGEILVDGKITSRSEVLAMADLLVKAAEDLARPPAQPAPITPRLRRPRLRSCKKCGCTDDVACPGGCHWIGPRLCSACGPGLAPPLASCRPSPRGRADRRAPARDPMARLQADVDQVARDLAALERSLA